MTKIILKVPQINELKYRQYWMQDLGTMAYNRGFDLNVLGYDKQTGIIIKSTDEMIDWYYKWTSNNDGRYYAYIYVSNISEPVGEVYYYPDGDDYTMGILIQNKYRNNGYGYLALMELEKIAFDVNNIHKLCDMIPEDRVNAIELFKKCGFVIEDANYTEKRFDKDIVIKKLYITKEMYFNNKKTI